MRFMINAKNLWDYTNTFSELVFLSNINYYSEICLIVKKQVLILQSNVRIYFVDKNNIISYVFSLLYNWLQLY